MYPPVHAIAQHLYDRRYGDHNGQRFDSPDDRAAIRRALRGPFPDIVPIHDDSGRLSLEWDQHFNILSVVAWRGYTSSSRPRRWFTYRPGWVLPCGMRDRTLGVLEYQGGSPL